MNEAVVAQGKDFSVMSDCMAMDNSQNSIVDLFAKPVDLDTFLPNCAACPKQVPLRRIMGRDAIRTRHTCSAACEKIVREADKLRTSKKMCRNCRHPSSPEERKDFIAWRKSRGDLQQRAGNPERWPQTKGSRIALARGLREALEFLKEEATFKQEVASFVESMKILIDEGAAHKRTLRTGGDSTAVSEGDENGIERSA